MNKSCRDCKHWDFLGYEKNLIKYSRDIHPENSIGLTGNCDKLLNKLDIHLSLSDGYVSSIETDANFSCGFFQDKSIE